MSHSIDSERPMLASGEPHGPATDPEIRNYKERLKRLEDQRMQDQRYQLSQQKMDEQSKLALVGKVQRSLERRYVNQDATMRPKTKPATEKK